MKNPINPSVGYAVVTENLITGMTIEVYREEYAAGAHAIYLREFEDNVTVWKYHVLDNMVVFDKEVEV